MPNESHQPAGPLDLALVGLSAFFCLRFLVIAAFLFAAASMPVGAAGSMLLVLKPLALAATVVLVMCLRRLFQEGSCRASWAGGLLVCGCVAAAYLVGPSGPQGLARRFGAMVPALIAPPAVVLCRRWLGSAGTAGPSLPALFVWAFACGAAALALLPSRVATHANGLGLASFVPDRVYVYDYAGSSNKDGYPTCRFGYNSLGYRDAQAPSGAKDKRKLVLLVGDSFVWGDGIPTDDQTLGALLRARLERLAPGRFRVMSAAYPGLGLYGYGRIIGALRERCAPDIVLVGYLGEADHDPLDAQAILDRLPADRLLRNLVLNLGAAQHLSEASVRHSARVWRSARNKDFFAELLGGMARQAREGGFRLVFLSYNPGQSLPDSIEELRLPPEWSYTGRSSDLWYAKDRHPKPKLNGLLAQRAAEALAGKGSRGP